MGEILDHKAQKKPHDARRNRKEAARKMNDLTGKRQDPGNKRHVPPPETSDDNLTALPAGPMTPDKRVKGRRPKVQKSDETSTDLRPAIVDERDTVMPRATTGVRR
jgi:hypothetical protein